MEGFVYEFGGRWYTQTKDEDLELNELCYIGKVKEKFDSLTDTSSLDRSGRAISLDSLDPVGIEPAMNPPMAVPIDIDREGTMNSLYN